MTHLERNPPADEDVLGFLHLSDSQMNDLLVRGNGPGAESLSTALDAAPHLHTCARCAAEFASLRQALTLFQQASVAHADRAQPAPTRLHSSAQPPYRAYPRSPFLWAAASILLVAGALPLELHRQHALRSAAPVTSVASTRSADSDEVLLDDINRELSASVPTPMQALADPTAPTAGRASQSPGRVAGESSTATKD